MNTLQESCLRRDIPKPLNDLLVIDMKRLIGLKGVVVMLLIFIAIPVISYSQTVFISEIHYDNSGTDSGEGFEIFAPAGTDLSCYQVILYNGSGGASYNTINLTGTAGDEGCGYDAIWTGLPTDGMQNGAPDGIALYNTCTSTLIQFLSYEGSFTATNGPANGVTSTDIGVSETGTTTLGHALQLSGTGTTYGDFSWNAPSANSAGTINSGMDPCVACSGPVAQPTTETTADIATPGCTGATISWTASTTADNVIVVVSTGAIGSTPTDGTAYTASASYGSGETIGANQYVVYNGSGTSVSITGLTSGTTYNYAIFGYDGAITDCEENYLTGGNFGSFTTLSSCDQAQITSLMVNSCNGTSEGTDELIVIENGDSPINVDDMVIDLPNTTWCNSGCGGNTIVNNATYLADLNAMAGCSPDLFVYSTTIPADATIIIFTGDPPSSVLDYSANCGAPGAPIYVLFLNNNSITGNFANSDPDPKITTIDFGNGDIETVTYIPDDVDNVDGGSVLFDDAGNPSYYTSTDCVYPLSLRIIEFEIYWKDDKSFMNWSAYHLENGNHYLIEHSVDGINFFPIGELNQMPLSDELNNYMFTDQNTPNTPQVYYRISLIDNYGKKLFSLNAVVYPNLDFVFYADGFLNFNFEEMYHQNYTVNIYSVNGEIIEKLQVQNSTSVPFNNEGVFIIEIVEKGTRQKIVTF